MAVPPSVAANAGGGPPFDGPVEGLDLQALKDKLGRSVDESDEEDEEGSVEEVPVSIIQHFQTLVQQLYCCSPRQEDFDGQAEILEMTSTADVHRSVHKVAGGGGAKFDDRYESNTTYPERVPAPSRDSSNS